MHQGTNRLTAAAALVCVLASAGAGNATAAPTDAASAAEAASVSYATGSQITVKPGQSLNDLAIAVTQSHDRATLVRASRALFDANPNAFMNHDPSRLRLGGVLTVPALDATGALAASSTAAGSAPVAGSAPSTADSATQNAAAPATAASAAAQANAAAASAAVTTTPVTANAASAAIDASAATQGGASTGAAASSAPASGAHVWTGSIQSTASDADAGAAPAQPASQARTQVSSLQQLLALKNRVLMELQKHGIGGSTAATGGAATSGQATPGASSATTPSQHSAATPAASNQSGISQMNLSIAAAVGAALVVLLAALRLSRRKRAKADTTSTDDVEVAPSAPQDPHSAAGAAVASEVHDDAPARHSAAVAAAGYETVEYGAHSATEPTEQHAAAERVEAEHVADAQTDHDAPFASDDVAAPLYPLQEPLASAESLEPTAASAQAALQNEHEPHGAVTPEPLPSTHHEHLNGATTSASLAAAAELGADALPLTSLEPVDEAVRQQDEAPRRLQWDDEPVAPLAGLDEEQHASQAPTADAASHVEPGDEVPAAVPFGESHEESAAHSIPEAPSADQDLTRAESHEPQPTAETVPPVDAPHAEPTPLAHVESDAEPEHPNLAAAGVEPDVATKKTSSFDLPPLPLPDFVPPLPTEFPRDALDAFGSLDMALPPRVESTNDAIHVPTLPVTQPVASPETTAQQALAPYDPDDAPHVVDEIEAGTAGHAAVAGLGATGFGAAGLGAAGLGAPGPGATGLGAAGLGAAGLGAAAFGALKLDFDLELPPGPSQPLPAFTQADLSRIARNKLDLASEYIDLGDLSGARTLINEVIEANDPATRNEARALLSTLAPLS